MSHFLNASIADSDGKSAYHTPSVFSKLSTPRPSLRAIDWRCVSPSSTSRTEYANRESRNFGRVKSFKGPSRNANSARVFQENLSLKVDALEQERDDWICWILVVKKNSFFLHLHVLHVLFLHLHEYHQDTLTNIAKTSLSSKFIGSESAVFCQIIVDAVKAVKVWVFRQSW